MKKLVFLTAVLFAVAANAQSYLISFSGSGASTVVSTVKAENLKTGAIVTLSGSDILRLNVTTDIHSPLTNRNDLIRVFPNPVTESSTIRIDAPLPGNVAISVFDLAGRPVASINDKSGDLRLEYSVSGTGKGAYIISVRGSAYHSSSVMTSNSVSESTFSIRKISNRLPFNEEKPFPGEAKGAAATIDMTYHAGDWIKFTGTSVSPSATYSTVVTNVPASDKTINFNFISCKDGDNNNYSIVQIGTNTWMAENLKTTKLNDGTAIPVVIGNIEWKNLTVPGCCWYNNNISNKEIYGGIYNFYAVNTGKLCPSGWHVASDSEWGVLVNAMGGSATAGNKLKDSGTEFWFVTTPYVTNESGFTVLGAGTRYIDENGGNIFSQLTQSSTFWSATNPYTRSFSSYDPEVFRGGFGNEFSGFSVRCIKN